MWTATRIAAFVAAALLPGALEAAICEEGRFEDVPFSACTVDPATEDVRLWHTAPDGSVYGTFRRIGDALAEEGRSLEFAMNGAMYHQDRSPVGLYIEDGIVHSGLVTSDGPGNFGLLPNGVFCIAESWAAVIESKDYAKQPPTCRHAAQSGPMLVIDGELHPDFLPDSDSTYIRNGVGVRPDGRIVFAISDMPVNFHRFARLFRDALGTPNALYIDGNVSRLYAPVLDRDDGGLPVGPIVGTTVPLN